MDTAALRIPTSTGEPYVTGDFAPLMNEATAFGVLRGWGNFYNGRINEHHYGQLVDKGDANVPQFGAEAEVGGFRFEYTRAHLQTTPREEPSADAPFH